MTHGPNSPGSYAILFFMTLEFTFTTDTSTAEHHFCFGPATSFFLELLVIAPCPFPLAYWTPSNLEGSSSSVMFFCLFMLSIGHSRQKYWNGLPFPPLCSTFCQNSSLCPLHLGGPAWHGSQLYWVMQAPSSQQGCDPWRPNDQGHTDKSGVFLQAITASL